jgi:hypothetical protein
VASEVPFDLEAGQRVGVVVSSPGCFAARPPGLGVASHRHRFTSLGQISSTTGKIHEYGQTLISRICPIRPQGLGFRIPGTCSRQNLPFPLWQRSTSVLRAISDTGCRYTSALVVPMVPRALSLRPSLVDSPGCWTPSVPLRGREPIDQLSSRATVLDRPLNQLSSLPRRRHSRKPNPRGKKT